MRASRLGFLEIAVALIAKGADINAVDNAGRSPLKLAATSNSYISVGDGALIEYLVKNGAPMWEAKNDSAARQGYQGFRKRFKSSV